MEQYIPKAAVVAEIERLHKEHTSKEYCDEAALVLEELEDFIDTLEVKEVDLEEEITHYFKGWGNNEIHCFAMMQDGTSVGIDECIDIAKHFFELGTHHSITKECVNEICQLFMEREAIEKFFPDSIDWVYKQLQKGE